MDDESLEMFGVVLVGSKLFRLSAMMGSALMEIIFHKNNNSTIYPVQYQT